MSVEQYQRTVNNLDKEIANLEKKKAAADKKAASEAKKAAGISISKNASDATRRSAKLMVILRQARKPGRKALIYRKKLLTNVQNEMMLTKSFKRNKIERRKGNKNQSSECNNHMRG